jgi:Tol biopolymer transport system component
LFAIASEGGDPVQLTKGPLDAYDPAWSPDGTRIAFDGDFIGKGNPGWGVYVMDADGSNVRDLTPTVGIGERDPAWSPDATWIAFQSGESGGPGQRLELVRPDGSDRKVIYRCECEGILSGPTWMPDGSTLAVAEGGRRIVLISPGGSDVQRLELDVESPPPETICCLAWQPRPR